MRRRYTHNLRLIWILLALSLCLVVGPIPEAKAQSVSIVELKFEGLRRVEADAVKLILNSRTGFAFSREKVSSDIKAIYGMGYFSDIAVFTEEVSPGKVRLIYKVVEKPAVRKILVEGNDNVSDDDIKEVIDIKPFTILSESKIKRNVQKIRDHLTEKGYFLAEVKYRVEKTSKSEVTVVFEIVENAKVEVRSIKFVGNKNIDADILRGSMATRVGDWISFLTDGGTYREEVFEIDLLRLSSQYFDRGYINVKVGSPDVEISPDRRYLYISINIDEGDQFRIGKLGFSGDFSKDEDHKDSIASKEGEIFNRTILGQDLLKLKAIFEDKGYAYANLTPLTSIDAEKKTVSLTFDAQQGEKVYYERINVIGNTKTRDKVIRRELRIFEGELTSSGLRDLSQRRVQALGYFEKVEVKTRKGTSDNQQIVDVEVKEKATGTFQIGAGFSSQESFIATAQISQQNFLGHGQLVSLSASLSALRQLFQFRFVEPYLLDTEWTLSMNAFNTETQFRSFLRTSSGGELSLGHPITDDIRGFLAYKLEFVRSRGADGLIFQPAFASLNNSGRISSLGTTITYDTRNNRLFPSDGTYVAGSVDVSDTLLGATETRAFQKYRLFSRNYFPLPFGFVGKFAARLGFINTLSQIGLSPSEKFIMGGINTIRGYAPFSIGPARMATRNDRGTNLYDPYSSTVSFVEGGNKEVLFNVELEFPLFAAAGIRGVLFADAGNVYAEDENLFYLDGRAREPLLEQLPFDPSSLPAGMFWSVGFGFRWFSPIGPLRFEWGIPLTRRPTDDTGPLFEFSIGNVF